MQRYNADGTPLNTNFRVDDDTSQLDQYSPTIALDRNGRQVVVWCDYRNGDDDPEIIAQTFQADGSPLGINRQINQPDLFPANNQWLIGQGVVANTLRISFAWIDNRRHQGWDIYSKIIDWNYMSGIEQTSLPISVNANQLELFPNPTHGKIYLTLDQINDSEINIYNSVGKMITSVIPYPHMIINNKLLIDLNRYTPGVYFINIKNQMTNLTKKIILY